MVGLKCLVFVLSFGVLSAETNGTNPLDSEELCKTQLCIPKCCPKGQYLYGFNKMCYSRKKGFQKRFNFTEVPLFNDDLSMSGRYLTNVTFLYGRILDKHFNETSFEYSSLHHEYFITVDGFLYEDVPNVLNRWTKLDSSRYCIDYMLPMAVLNMTKPEIRYVTQYLHSTPSDNNFITYGLVTSCFFLALVLLVYSLLRELRNLSGRVLMAYVACLMGGFMLLAMLQVGNFEYEHCLVMTYFIHFLLMASFCWMNIMSCDIWWTFRGYAKARPIHRRGETFKFCMYCIYAFGLPAALTTMVILLNGIDVTHIRWFIPPSSIQSGCFFSDDGKMLYLYAPMLVLIVCNWIFFLMTAFNIWRLHRATAVLDSAAAGTPAAHRSQKTRFLVYLKLSVIMGINWLLEVVSSFSPDFKGWYISDFYNMLIGLSIFLIFVCKKKIYRMLVKRLSGCNVWSKSRPWHSTSRSRSHSSNTTESDVSADVPVCNNPKGPNPLAFERKV